MDIEYINDMYWLIMKLSHKIRNRKKLNESEIDELLTLSIDLLNLLEMYKSDKYDY
ncbi:MAG: hypothetical protein RSA87_04315 [Malacoplasma sp.]